ncbi:MULTISPECIES: serine protease [unclassified Brachybacterium]|uniref:trypsin-like serine peptidase n=1 Tax=unclassified Brachybacterium TaxID=2623841 RepID=UPI001E420D60|nr:trypsin-like peptidase domain-containing protein [Brachybacterium sp. UMB0905]
MLSDDHVTSPTRSRLMARLGRASGGLAVAAMLSIGGAGLATADGGGDDLETTSFSQSAQEDTEAYWTPERMEAAIPADELVADAAPADGAVETSATTTIPGAQASPKAQGGNGKDLKNEDGWPGEDDPIATGDTDHIGKVFFTVNGQDYVCSGNSVASTNGNTVSTAGHCTNEAGTWASNWAFAPGYDHGETPHGLWTATELYAPQQWVSGEDMNYDVAFAVVAPEDGMGTLTEAVGASGIEFNTQRGSLITSYGYPAGSPFDGESLEQCQGTGFDDTIGDTDDQAIDCDMTGGSSGGPWFIGDGPDGLQISVNSFGYTMQPNVMYGPYLGDVAQEVYETAANA